MKVTCSDGYFYKNQVNSLAAYSVGYRLVSGNWFSYFPSRRNWKLLCDFSCEFVNQFSQNFVLQWKFGRNVKLCLQAWHFNFFVNIRNIFCHFCQVQSIIIHLVLVTSSPQVHYFILFCSIKHCEIIEVNLWTRELAIQSYFKLLIGGWLVKILIQTLSLISGYHASGRAWIKSDSH